MLDSFFVKRKLRCKTIFERSANWRIVSTFWKLNNGVHIWFVMIFDICITKFIWNDVLFLKLVQICFWWRSYVYLTIYYKHGYIKWELNRVLHSFVLHNLWLFWNWFLKLYIIWILLISTISQVFKKAIMIIKVFILQYNL